MQWELTQDRPLPRSKDPDAQETQAKTDTRFLHPTAWTKPNAQEKVAYLTNQTL